MLIWEASYVATAKTSVSPFASPDSVSAVTFYYKMSLNKLSLYFHNIGSNSQQKLKIQLTNILEYYGIQCVSVKKLINSANLYEFFPHAFDLVVAVGTNLNSDQVVSTATFFVYFPRTLPGGEYLTTNILLPFSAL